MFRNYRYNNQYISDLIKKVEAKLTSGNLTPEQIEDFTSDKLILESLRNKDYSYFTRPDDKKSKMSLTEAKEKYIGILRQVALGISPTEREFFRNIYRESFFYENPTIKCHPLQIKKVIDLSMKTFKAYSPTNYEYAKKLFNDPNTNHVLISRKVEDSITKNISITQEPFILHTPHSHQNILIHEMEHGIEWYRNLYHTTLGELGPIFFELLFLQKQYDLTGKFDMSSLLERFDDNACHLPVINAYFNIMEALEKRNYQISDEDFVKLIMDEMEFSKEGAIDHIYEDPGDDLNEYIMYVLSFLKAVESLYFTRNVKGDRFEFVEKQLKQERIDFLPEQEAFPIYDDFLSQVYSGNLKL